MPWITTKEGKHINTDWFDNDERRKQEQISKNKDEATARNNEALNDAIKAYTAMGGQYASKYPLTAAKQKLLLEEMSGHEYTTQEDIYRKVDLSEKDYNALFNTLYNDDSKDINFDRLQSFTKERSRAFGYGGSQMQYVIYKIPKGTKVYGDDITERSLYKVEKEVLLGKNTFTAHYKDLEWTSSGNMIITLREKS